MIKTEYTVISGEIAKVDGGYVLRFSAYPESYERDRCFERPSHTMVCAARKHWECVCKTWDQASARLREFMEHEEAELHGSAHE